MHVVSGRANCQVITKTLITSPTLANHKQLHVRSKNIIPFPIVPTLLLESGQKRCTSCMILSMCVLISKVLATNINIFKQIDNSTCEFIQLVSSHVTNSIIYSTTELLRSYGNIDKAYIKASKLASHPRHAFGLQRPPKQTTSKSNNHKIQLFLSRA